MNRLGFGAKRAMQIAQGLYEGIDLGKDGGPVGLITYMRTDSTRLSPDAVEAAREYIADSATARRTSPRSPTSSSRRRTRRTRTRPSARRRSSCTPESVRQAPEGRPVQALQADLGALPRQPDDARGLRPDERRHRGRRRRTGPSYGLRASGRILKFSGWLEAYGKGEIPKAAAPLAGEGEGDAEAGDGRGRSTEGRTARTSWPRTREATLPELDRGRRRCTS